MCYVHWLIKKLSWFFDRPVLNWVDRTEFWEEESRVKQTPCFSYQRRMVVRLMLVSQSQVAIHINRNGLIKMWGLASKRLQLMDQAVFKWIQFVCCYFGCKASHVGTRWDEKQACPLLLLHTDTSHTPHTQKHTLYMHTYIPHRHIYYTQI